jgi:hypothetical protein
MVPLDSAGLRSNAHIVSAFDDLLDVNSHALCIDEINFQKFLVPSGCSHFNGFEEVQDGHSDDSQRRNASVGNLVDPQWRDGVVRTPHPAPAPVSACAACRCFDSER